MTGAWPLLTLRLFTHSRSSTEIDFQSRCHILLSTWIDPKKSNPQILLTRFALPYSTLFQYTQYWTSKSVFKIGKYQVGLVRRVQRLIPGSRDSWEIRFKNFSTPGITKSREIEQPFTSQSVPYILLYIQNYIVYILKFNVLWSQGDIWR